MHFSSENTGPDADIPGGVQTVSLPEAGCLTAVGLSGGVDSACTALMLKERGCRVIGVTMSSWNNDLPLPPSKNGVRMSCYGSDEKLDIAQCAAFCKEHGIEYRVIDVREAYKTYVLDYFKREYRAGRTPNPCVHCNRHVKFGALLDGVRDAGIDFDYFCTGHYASLVRPNLSPAELYRTFALEEEIARPAVCEACESGESGHPLLISAAKDRYKDQTYFLHRIPSRVLERVRFPLSGFTKREIFDFARSRKLASAARSESQDFISSEYFDIVFADKASVPGDIVDLDGKLLGRHRGIEHYTVGQRRGLGVSANRPLYVHSIDVHNNRVILAGGDELLSQGLQADSWVWAGGCVPSHAFTAEVKIRLASPAARARIVPLGDGIFNIFFEKPQRAVAPGQSAVVYLNHIIAGGGIITRSL
ncbi:tRNA methyl transferase PRC-barrel domain-containing protein [Treponema sp. HNW]|uniref:MnmA/TRMU family protein n=1 Tax=Treponema sp. HNW TaxID=3116654 RepID=UPI003D0F601E